MVKKLLGKMLGKGDKAEEPKADSTDVPDELPPLAEDLVKDIQAPAPTQAMPAPQATPAAPAQPISNQAPAQPLQQGFSGEDATQGLVSAYNAPSPQITSPHPTMDPPAYQYQDPEITLGNMPLPRMGLESSEASHPTIHVDKEPAKGFFDNVLQVVQRQGVIKDKLFERDMFNRMQQYWNTRDSGVDPSLPSPKKMEFEVINKLTELKDLEHKWRIQRQVLEHDQKYLSEREKDIKKVIQELAVRFKQLRHYQDVAPDQYFTFRNGMVAKNLSELLDIIRIVDPATLAHHVNEHRNDLILWVSGALHDHHLAKMMQNKTTREDIIEAIVTSALPHAKHDVAQARLNFKDPIQKIRDDLSRLVIDPTHYFWLKNGVCVKSIKDLFRSIQGMDSDTFRYHVTHSKNDFAQWVHDVYRQEELAAMMKKLVHQQELIELLQVYVV